MIREPFESLASHYLYLKRNKLIDDALDWSGFYNSRFGINWYEKHLCQFERKDDKCIYIYYEDYIKNPVITHLTLGELRKENRDELNIRTVVERTNREAMSKAESQKDSIDKNFSSLKKYSEVKAMVKESEREYIRLLQERYELSKG